MNLNQFKIARLVAASFIAATVAIAVTTENILLAFAAVLSGMFVLVLARKRTKAVLSDERTEKIVGLATRYTYAISTSFIALISLFLIMSGKQSGDAFTESVGTILSFTVLLSIAIFAMSLKYFDKLYGNDE